MMAVFGPVAALSSICLAAAGFQPPADHAFVATADGSTQRYVELLPDSYGAQQPHDLLLAFHGHGSDRWQYVRETRGECRGARDVAARHQMVFVAPDYRAPTSWMGPLAEADTVQLIAELRQRHQIARVFLVGGSMGGSSVLTFAVLHPELIAGVSSQNGLANHLEYPNFQEFIAASFGGTKAQVPGEYRRRSAEFQPERLTMPVGFTVGGLDTSVPPDSARRLAAELARRKQPVLLIDRPQTGHETSYADTVAALEFVLAAAR